MIGTRVKCPECGATTAATSGVLRCPYCGAESTTVPKLQSPLPPAAPGFAAQVEAQRKNAKFVYIGVFGVILASMIIPAVIGGSHATPVVAPAIPAAPQTVAAATPIEPPKKPTTAEEIEDWITARPMFADVDGDSLVDAIGLVRHKGDHDETRLAAHSGKDGHLLWESESLGDDVTSSEAARVNGVIVWANTDAPMLAGFDLETGKQRWKVTSEESVESYCRANGHLLVALKDKSQFTLDPATGALTKLPKPVACHETARQGDISNNHLFEIKGFNVNQFYKDADGTVFAGVKWSGVSAEMVAASNKRGTVLWKANLASHAEVRATRPARPTLDFDSEIVAEPVLYNGRTPYLEVFDRKTGERKLDVPIMVVDRPHEPPLSKIATAISKDAIYVVVRDDLQAYARTTGALLWHLKP